ncbi:MAG: hypothetical protein WC879_07930 [Melioribacteraceae bacterium]
MRISKLFLFIGIVGLILVSGCNNSVEVATPTLRGCVKIPMQ